MLQPVKLSPVFKDYLWGGEKLKSLYNKKCDMDIVAESWELSCHKDGECRIIGGEFDGETLSTYIKNVGKGVLGTNSAKFDYFPILIKIIDAKGDLSVQVHPDDEYALKNEGEYGKTEMWYILDCEEGASLYYGFNRDITKEEYEDAIKNNTLTDILNKVPVNKGDVFFIPSGTVHAIGKGIVICEIQQNSNTTYRVYDYNRKDKDGNTRPLHIAKALEVSNLKKAPEIKKTPSGEDVLLAQCEYFKARKIVINEKMNRSVDTTSFECLTVIEGRGKICMKGFEVVILKGDSVFIPAQKGEYDIYGNCEIIVSYL